MFRCGLLITVLWAMPAVSFAQVPASKVGEKSQFYFPTSTEWKTVEPSAVGWNPDALKSAVAFAMSRKSSGVVILHRGRILAEEHAAVEKPSIRYRGMLHGKDADGHVIEDVASIQKSIASILVGIAQEKELLKLTDPVNKHLDVGWSNATTEQEGQITIRHLVSMSTGLTDRLQYSDPPGTEWRYNSNAYCLCVRAVAAASGMTPNELTRTWLTEPLGMSDSRWVERRLSRISPPETNKLGFATTARDVARFGLLVLANGKWNGATVLADQHYLRAALSPSQKMNPAYGYLWWLNGQEATLPGLRRSRGPLNAAAPDDLVAALGALGRKCYIVPSLNLVVVRLGDNPEVIGQEKFDVEFWRQLIKAAPKNQQ